MSVLLDGDVIRLTGAGRIEDAEALVALLQAHPGCRVDLTACGPLHTAVVQVLVAFRPELAGQAGDGFLRAWVMPLLASADRSPR